VNVATVRKLKALLALAALAAAAVLVINVVGCAAVHRGGTSVPRDPDTGIMQGGGPVRIEGGRPRACLLLHGWLTTPADFGELPQRLDEAGWDVHAPLQVGHGTRPADLVGVGADGLLDGARGHYLDLLARYDEVALVGFSMGGTMATVLAAERPPARLVLVNPFCAVRYRWYYVLPPRWWWPVLSPVLRHVWRGRGVHVNRAEDRARIPTYTAFPASIADALFELRRRMRREADLDALTMPALLVCSTGDDVCAVSAADGLFEAMPSADKEKVVFSRSNHHLLHDHDADAAVEAVVRFLGQE